MKQNQDSTSKILTGLSLVGLAALIVLFIVFLFSGCSARQTGATAPVVEDAAALGPTSLQASEPLEAEPVAAEEVLSCADFRRQMTAIQLGNYHAGGWDGTLTSMSHEDHEHTIQLVYDQTVVVDDFRYGDINLPAGAFMSMCIKQGQERTYLQEFDETIGAYRAGDRVAIYTNPQGYSLYLSLQSPADDVRYLVAKDTNYTAVSTLAVLNLETKDWQVLSTTWADGQYWFSETGKTLFYQDIDGQAYKFDLMLPRTEPVPVDEHYDGTCWTARLIVSDDSTGTLRPAPAGYSLVRDTDFSAQEDFFIANMARLGGETEDKGLFISRDGIISLMSPEGAVTLAHQPWQNERGVNIMDICEDFYDGDDTSIPAHTIRLLVESWVKGSGVYSLDVLTVAADRDGNADFVGSGNIAHGKCGVAEFNSEGRYRVGLHVVVDGERLFLEDYESALETGVYDLVPLAELQEQYS